MQRIPDFFIVGQPKTGSTALYLMLREHPDIYLSDPKEPNFFAPDLDIRMADDWHRPEEERSLAAYLQLFDGAREDQVAGEASVRYLVSHVAARTIAEFNPAARIIAVLREPAGLLRSLHAQRVWDGAEHESDLRTALAHDGQRIGGPARRASASPRWPKPTYSAHVRYVDQLERFSRVFPADQLLILLYDDYLKDNLQTVRTVQQFLGVDAGWTPAPQTANPSETLRFPRTMEALNRLSHGHGRFYGAGKRVITTLAGPWLSRRLLIAANRRMRSEKIPLDEELMAELRAKYAPEVHRLSEYLGRDLTSLWGAGDGPHAT